jgi:hypothetical protein
MDWMDFMDGGPESNRDGNKDQDESEVFRKIFDFCWGIPP